MPLVLERLRALIRKRRNSDTCDKTIISVHRDRIVVVLSILAILLIGFPFWWTTTRVYRAKLPVSEIEEYARDSTLSIPWAFHISSDEKTLLTDGILRDVQAQIARRNPTKASHVSLTLGNAAVPDAPGHYSIRVASGGAGRCSSVVGVGRTANVTVGSAKSLSGDLAAWISEVVGPEERWAGAPVRGSQAHSEKALKYSPEYAITFTLVNGNEGPPGAASADWDIERAVDLYVQPMVDYLRPLANLTVTTQVLHRASLGDITPKRISGNATENVRDSYYLTPDMLPHFINTAQWNLASTNPVSPMLNFILYVPGPSAQPMHIRQHSSKDRTMQRSATDAFLLPQWGGVAIANERAAVLSHQTLRPYFGIFVAQLRTLLGIHTTITASSSSSSNSPYTNTVMRAHKAAISEWEFDAIAREWAQHNHRTALTTLKSLTRLLASMPNIVVKEDVKARVEQSLESLRNSTSATSTLDAFAFARAALTHSEGAFFDPSVVSMLYFPDQHKYAIYLPFFLPVTIPLLHALRKIAVVASEARRTGREKKDN